MITNLCRGFSSADRGEGREGEVTDSEGAGNDYAESVWVDGEFNEVACGGAYFPLGQLGGPSGRYYRERRLR